MCVKTLNMNSLYVIDYIDEQITSTYYHVIVRMTKSIDVFIFIFIM